VAGVAEAFGYNEANGFALPGKGSAMRVLKTCLWIAGLLCLLAVFGVFLPLRVLQSLASAFGGSLPEGPVFVYMVRVMSATYVAIGVFYVMLARDPIRYGVMVPFSGVAALSVGACCGLFGVLSGMPLLWFLGDFLCCVVLGVLILAFWRRATGDET